MLKSMLVLPSMRTTGYKSMSLLNLLFRSTLKRYNPNMAISSAMAFNSVISPFPKKAKTITAKTNDIFELSVAMAIPDFFAVMAMK